MILTKDKSFYKELFSLSAPMALSNLITFLITLSDSIMIGRLGDVQIAAAYVGTLAATVMQMLITGFESGMIVIGTQYYGKGDMDKIKKTASSAIIFMLTAGVSFCALLVTFKTGITHLFLSGESVDLGVKYLNLIAYSFPFFALSGALTSVFRCVESVKINVISSLSALFINLVFNYLLIFGNLGFTKMGIEGAGIATVIARITELAILLIYTFLIDKKIKLRSFFATEKASFSEFIKYTLPIVVGQTIWIVNTLFSSFIISKFGKNETVAAFSIANTLGSVAYIAMNGLSSAVGIIIGKTIGENKLCKIKEYSYTTQILFLALGVLTSLFLAVSKIPFVSLYNSSEATVNIAKSLITVLCFTVIGTSYQSASLMGVVRAGGDVSFILKNDAVFIFLIVIPLSLLAKNLGAPVWLVFLALKSDQILKCIPAAIKINRFRWIRKIAK